MKDKIDEVESDQSNTILYFENLRQVNPCMWRPENNFAGYIGQSYFNADGVERANA